MASLGRGRGGHCPLFPFPSPPYSEPSGRGKVVTGEESAARGKLIIACGNFKTFTRLQIAVETASHHGARHMRVALSTRHSVEVISRAWKL